MTACYGTILVTLRTIIITLRFIIITLWTFIKTLRTINITLWTILKKLRTIRQSRRFIACCFHARFSPYTNKQMRAHRRRIFKTLVNEDRRPTNENFRCHYSEYVLSSCLSIYLKLIAAFLYNYWFLFIIIMGL